MNFTKMKPAHGRGGETADRDRAVGAVIIRPTMRIDAPTKTAAPKVRNRRYLSTFMRFLSTGGVSVA